MLLEVCKAFGIEGLRGFTATNERQDDGAGISHQVAQFPTDQVYLGYTQSHPCPSPPTQEYLNSILNSCMIHTMEVILEPRHVDADDSLITVLFAQPQHIPRPL